MNFQRIAALVMAQVLLGGSLALATSPVMVATPKKVMCPFEDTTLEVAFEPANPPYPQLAFGFMIAALPVCPKDGFVFYKLSFTEKELRALKPLIATKEFKALKSQSPHYRAAWLEERIGAAPGETARSLLFATWEYPTGAAYTRYATALLHSLPAAIAAEPDLRKRLKFQLLEGDTLRRLGRLDEAKDRFEKFLADFGEGDLDSDFAHWELGLIAKRDRNDHKRPSIDVPRDLHKPEYLVARLPVREAESRFRRTISQIVTDFEEHYVWDQKSRFLIYTDSNAGAFEAVSMADGTSKTIQVPESDGLVDHPFSGIVTGLHDGNVLLYAGGDPLDSKSAMRYLEMNPETSRIESSTGGPYLFGEFNKNIWRGSWRRQVAAAFDGRFVVLGWKGRDILTYNVATKHADQIAGPDAIAGVFSTDPTGPRIVLVTSRDIRDGRPGDDAEIVVWDYENRKIDTTIPVKCETMESLCNVVDTAIDGKRRILYVLLSDYANPPVTADPYRWLGNRSELRSFDLTSGQLLDTKSIGEHGVDRIIPPERRSPFYHPFYRDIAAGLSIGADGRYLSYHWGSEVDIVDAASPGKILERLTAPRDYRIETVQFSPDGRYLAIEIDQVASVLSVEP